MFKEGQIRIPSACGLIGFINRRRKNTSGYQIVSAMTLMRERGNGLGAGFAGYGIYPDRKDYYAFHLFYENRKAKEETSEFLYKYFDVAQEEKIPTRKVKNIKDSPIIWRYFLKPKEESLAEEEISEGDFVVERVMEINTKIDGAYIFSSGKNMGVFKGVGYPEDIGEFYKLEEYKGYLWTAHTRFPTNTPGWWGGAHPFSLLDWSVVHNGEISSYGTNARYVEMFGYKCTLRTDTEVITYLIDLLTRKHQLSWETTAKILSAPFYNMIDRLDEEEKKKMKAIRIVYQNCLLNGPFAIIVGFSQGMIALNDRIKLRPLVAAEKGEVLYVASEESAIRELCNNPDRVWMPKGGEPVIGLLEKMEVLA
ncbi:MAG TPA: glutamine amidotransferase family protein [Dictyoglomaceae bacterium]|nr:glutamine amidotransferase family protein [Dictyoglomaceae bacterium]HOL39357.1 glutamine amidotransferase family protein [Dictyoglomaceae bacterium]HPP15961.1 glutamine amidotransferase family protein [Dictyoglomaceae bacterium]HPU44067.1 glutamine amidotransferase family protein [Dictyoglomaceae bacterium]